MAIDTFSVTNNTASRSYGETLITRWAAVEGYNDFALDNWQAMRSLAAFIDKTMEEDGKA